MSLDDFITEFLGNEKFWFSQSPEQDAYLTEKYGHLLHIPNSDNHAHLAILYDQLPRHVFRNSQSHMIEYFLELALMHYDHVCLDTLTDVEWCFVHLPLRHQGDPEWITRVAQKAWERVVPGCNPFMLRFIKATYERCPVADQSQFIKTTYADTIFSSVTHRDTLDFIPPDAVISIDLGNPVVKAVRKALDTHRPTKLLMSISGGSDSMVAFHIVSGLRSLYQYDLEVVTVNYTNRKTAYDEEAFVTEWVNSLGYPLHVRRIEEIKRQKCVETDMRTTYEKYTRQVRFSTYKTIASDALVVMGHNKDDCLENILQNIGNCHKYENLSGMDTLVVQDGISFFRPLLDISKEDIVEYAEMHQIPFLPNSTPAHFHRGKIRNRVVPVLDSWNNLFIPGLFHAKDTMSQMHNVVEMSVAMVADKFENNTASLDVSYLKMGDYFWKLCLKKLFPAEKMSNKMFASLIELFTRAPQDTRFEVNKNLKLHMTIANATATLRFYHTNM